MAFATEPDRRQRPSDLFNYFASDDTPLVFQSS
jgi:hypothetical protein